MHCGLGWLTPLLRIAAGDSVSEQLGELKRVLVIPLVGIAIFIVAWSVARPARRHLAWGVARAGAGVGAGTEPVGRPQGRAAKEAEFYERQAARNAALAEAGKADEVKVRNYTGKPTYFDQIVTSLKTVGLGFVIATLIAVPLGIACGLSKTVNGAINPLIQLFKPVSPLAWLPIVTMVVSALYVNPSDALPKSLLISAITVHALLALADAHQYGTRRRLHRQGPRQRRQGAAALDADEHP